MDLFCVVAPEQHGLIGTRTLQKEVRRLEHELLPVNPGLKANQRPRLGTVEHGLHVVTGTDKIFSHGKYSYL